MRLRIDPSGRVLIPKALRDAAGFGAGAVVDATVRDGRIELEVPPAEVRLERRGRVVVAVPECEVPTLRTEDVQATVDALRAGRR